jgi:hypothetical protein
VLLWLPEDRLLPCVDAGMGDRVAVRWGILGRGDCERFGLLEAVIPAFGSGGRPYPDHVVADCGVRRVGAGGRGCEVNSGASN